MESDLGDRAATLETELLGGSNQTSGNVQGTDHHFEPKKTKTWLSQ